MTQYQRKLKILQYKLEIETLKSEYKKANNQIAELEKQKEIITANIKLKVEQWNGVEYEELAEQEEVLIKNNI